MQWYSDGGGGPHCDGDRVFVVGNERQFSATLGQICFPRQSFISTTLLHCCVAWAGVRCRPGKPWPNGRGQGGSVADCQGEGHAQPPPASTSRIARRAPTSDVARMARLNSSRHVKPSSMPGGCRAVPGPAHTGYAPPPQAGGRSGSPAVPCPRPFRSRFRDTTCCWPQGPVWSVPEGGSGQRGLPQAKPQAAFSPTPASHCVTHARTPTTHFLADPPPPLESTRGWGPWPEGKFDVLRGSPAPALRHKRLPLHVVRQPCGTKAVAAGERGEVKGTPRQLAV